MAIRDHSVPSRSLAVGIFAARQITRFFDPRLSDLQADTESPVRHSRMMAQFSSSANSTMCLGRPLLGSAERPTGVHVQQSGHVRARGSLPEVS